MRKISAHGVNLSFDGIARDGALGPAFGNHCTNPHFLYGKQNRCINQLAGPWLYKFGVQRIAMQCKVRRFCNNRTSKDCLKLGSSFKPLH